MQLQQRHRPVAGIARSQLCPAARLLGGVEAVHAAAAAPQCRPAPALRAGLSEPVPRRASVACAAQAVDAAPRTSSGASTSAPALNVLIAGAGIGGLVLALALLKKGGVNVKVLERDFTAIRGEGKYRGPIQASREPFRGRAGRARACLGSGWPAAGPCRSRGAARAR
jgi:hypothetical protein